VIHWSLCGLLFDRVGEAEVKSDRLPYSLLALGLALLLWGSYWGLFLAPAEAYMGDVQKASCTSRATPGTRCWP